MKFSVTQSMILTVLAALGTAVAALVPAWGPQEKIIVATIGTVVTALFPLVNAQHVKAAAHASVGVALAQSGVTALHVIPAPEPATQPVDAAAIQAQAEAAMRDELAQMRTDLANDLAARVAAAVAPPPVVAVPPPAA